MENNATQIFNFGMYVGQIADDFQVIQSFIRDEATNKSGFTGLMSPLQAVMDSLNDLCYAANNELGSKLVDVSMGLQSTATTYGQIETDNTNIMNQAGA